jgi:EAL domain-containing protein (putative c-di-GMP-specific phosphodiesterase class I)
MALKTAKRSYAPLKKGKRISMCPVQGPAIAAESQRCLRVLDTRQPRADRSPDVLSEIRFDEKSKHRVCARLISQLHQRDVSGLSIQVCQTSPDRRWVNAARAVPFASFRELVVEQWIFPRIRRGGLRTFFQPIVRKTAGDGIALHGHECLVRCPLALDGTLTAQELFRLAWTDRLREELHAAAFWQCLRATSRVPNDQRLYINVDPVFLPGGTAFWNRVRNLLDENSFPAHRIVIEIVESASHRDLVGILRFVHEARALGMLIAIDDFGAQRDPFQLFHSVRPDVIKLEPELVHHCGNDPWRRRTCEHLISLASDLGVDCVVEGIEDDLDLAWCCEQPARLMQGYRFGRPAVEPVTDAALAATTFRKPHFSRSIPTTLLETSPISAFTSSPAS